MRDKTLNYPNVQAELARNSLNAAMLADFMGQTRQNVYNKLNGKTVLTLKDMRTIQEFFKVKGGGDYSLDYLFESGD